MPGWMPGASSFEMLSNWCLMAMHGHGACMLETSLHSPSWCHMYVLQRPLYVFDLLLQPGSVQQQVLIALCGLIISLMSSASHPIMTSTAQLQGRKSTALKDGHIMFRVHGDVG